MLRFFLCLRHHVLIPCSGLPFGIYFLACRAIQIENCCYPLSDSRRENHVYDSPYLQADHLKFPPTCYTNYSRNILKYAT